MKVEVMDSYSGMAQSVSGVENMSAKWKKDTEVISTEQKIQEPEELQQKGVEVDQEKLVSMLERVNQFAEVQQVNLRLKVDDDTEQIVVSVVDHGSGDVIRQIPSEHAIKLAKGIDEALQEFFSPNPDQAIHFLSDEA